MKEKELRQARQALRKLYKKYNKDIEDYRSKFYEISMKIDKALESMENASKRK